MITALIRFSELTVRSSCVKRVAMTTLLWGLRSFAQHVFSLLCWSGMDLGHVSVAANWMILLLCPVVLDWLVSRYAASDSTTKAARLVFISYMMVVSLLLAQLIIGVIVNLFTDIQRLNSEQLYTWFAKFTSTADVQVHTILISCTPLDLRLQERGAIEDDVLKLNTLLIPLHEVSDATSSGVALEDHAASVNRGLPNGIEVSKPGFRRGSHVQQIVHKQCLADFVTEKAR